MLTIEYIAGFFDADGTVGYYPYTKKNRLAPPAIRCRLQLAFANNDEALLGEIREFFNRGGTFGWSTSDKNKGNPVRHFRVLYAYAAAIEVLEQLVPHLHIKKAFSEACLKRCSEKSLKPLRVRDFYGGSTASTRE